MNRKAYSVIMVTLLSIGILPLVFNIQRVEAEVTIGSIHSGSGVANDLSYINFGMGDIFWSAATIGIGYFYGSFGETNVFFANRIEDYYDPYDSYQGVEYIWDFTNASDHDWFTEYAIAFYAAREHPEEYTGILLIQQDGLYGAIRPRSVHDDSGTLVLEYDWWYDDSGGSDFSSLKPSVAIYTGKYTYHAGETMHLGLNVTNPGNMEYLCFAIGCELPDSSVYLVEHQHSVVLPMGFEYSNPSFQTFTLPSLPTGTYTWHVAILDRATHTIIVHGSTDWGFS